MTNTVSKSKDVNEFEEKGLPEYSIKGGLCNEKGCLNICSVLCYDGIWRCCECAAKLVKGFINAMTSIGGPV